MDNDYDQEELPHTLTPNFNPYKDSNISAVTFTVEAVNESRVRVNIIDPLTSMYKDGKQLSIRDILKNDLEYKISYWKSGSTGKRDTTSNSSMAEVSDLDKGISYCFMVAAYIPSRPKNTRHGAWSKQQCTNGHGNLNELSVGAWLGVVVSLLTITVIIIIVTVLCCKQRNKPLNASQPV